MIVYAESSALLAWLLGQAEADLVQSRLKAATAVIASDLTLVECDRTLIRSVALGEMPEVEASALRADLTDVSDHWTLLHIDGQAVRRARRPFPVEPLRSLDALHLAVALDARATQPDIALLSLDRRVRTNGAALGFVLEPSDDELEAVRSADGA